MGHQNYMKSFDASSAPVQKTELEFPDLRGMDFYTPRLSAEAALRQNEEYVRHLAPMTPVREAGEKCEVEFIL